MTDLTTQTPVEIDQQLAALYGRLYSAQDSADRAKKDLDSIRKRIERSGNSAWNQQSLDRCTERREALEAVVTAIHAEILPFAMEYERRGRWTRAFKVTNAGGHIHRDMACQTCFVTTQFAWLPEVSGMDEAEIVELAAAAACTVCYPTAPVDRPTQLFTASERATQAERDAKAAAKVEREAKRIAKAATLDGSELVVHLDEGRYPEYVKTLVTARSLLADAFFWQTRDITAFDYPVLVAAIAAKEGKTEEVVIEEAKVRASKRK